MWQYQCVPGRISLSESLLLVQLLDQAVVLLMRHGPAGSSGFIINRPTQFTVGDVTKKLEAFEGNPLFVGGDVGEVNRWFRSLCQNCVLSRLQNVQEAR